MNVINVVFCTQLFVVGWLQRPSDKAWAEISIEIATFAYHKESIHLRFTDLFFLYCYMGAVLVVLLFATAMERRAIKDRISGANGFVWTMLSLFLAVALVPISLLAWLFGTFNSALITLIGGAIFLAIVVKVTLNVIVMTKPRERR